MNWSGAVSAPDRVVDLRTEQRDRLQVVEDVVARILGREVADPLVRAAAGLIATLWYAPPETL